MDLRGKAFVAILVGAITVVSALAASSVILPGSGPVSTYPAAWTTVCGHHPVGMTTTRNNLQFNLSPELANISLDHVYQSIVSSPSFRLASLGHGWVTAEWDSVQSSGLKGSEADIVGLFVLTSFDSPAGYVDAYYNIANGNVETRSMSSLFSSCPAIISSAIGLSLDEPSPGYYPSGRPVGMIFSATDYELPNLTLSSPTSCMFSFDIRAESPEGAVVYNSTLHPLCSGTPIKVVLTPGKSYEQTLVWNQTDDEGRHVPYGAYEVTWLSAGTGYTQGESPAGKVYLGIPIPADRSFFRNELYFEMNANNGSFAPGRHIRIAMSLTNNGGNVTDFTTRPCSLSYKVLNLTESVVYTSTAHSNCEGTPANAVLAPMGSISRISYWNQTDDSGRPVEKGIYTIVANAYATSGKATFNQTKTWVLQITTPSQNMISISSASLCASNCVYPSPYLSATVFVNGISPLHSLHLFVNGTDEGSRTYSNVCCLTNFAITFKAQLRNQTFVVSGAKYVVAFIATFEDGTTSYGTTFITVEGASSGGRQG